MAPPATTTWSSPIARWLLDSRLQPGGAAVTRRLAELMGIGQTDHVVDVACGRGESARLLARERGCRVTGVDVGAEPSGRFGRPLRPGLRTRLRFVTGPPDQLPLEAAEATAALGEGVLCFVPEREAVLAEMARIVAPGGRVGLADLTAEPRRLPIDLRRLGGPAASLGRARPLEELTEAMSDVGLVVRHVEPHDEDLAELLFEIQNRLRRLSRTTGAAPWGVRRRLASAMTQAALARSAVDAGSLGYVVVVADRP